MIDSAPRRVLASLFRPFAKVEPEEVPAVAIMTLLAFLLLTAYYLLKTVREPLILLQGGAEVKLYARAAQAVIMVGVVHLYGELARRVGRTKLLVIVFLFFISNLVLFTFLARTSARIGLGFFLWVGVFSYTAVAQLWALGADLFKEEQGRRLFPLIGGGSSLGAVAGARLARSLVTHGPSMLMAVAAVILLICVGLIVWVERRARPPTGDAVQAPRDIPLSREGAFHLLMRDKYLLLIAGMAVVLNWVNSSGEYVLDRTLLVAASGHHTHGLSPEAFIGAFKADYFAWYNGIGLVLQLFAVSRVLHYVGVRRALLLMPMISFGGYAVATFLPVLAVIRVVKIAENSVQYSLQDTTRHALFLVTSRVEKFVGKTSVDTIAVRVGSVMSALVVWFGTRRGMSLPAFAAVNAGLALVWLALVVAIGREHRQRCANGVSDEHEATSPSTAEPIREMTLRPTH